MNAVCIFCGSSMGSNEAYRNMALEVANIMLEKKIDLVYGGSNVGLMKILADRTLEGGGRAIGVMPRNLVDKEVAHTGLTEMHVVESMSERKNLMIQLSDAFISLPGGFGTLDEMIEVLTYNQLRLVDKPLGILNVINYYDPMLRFFDAMVSQGFLRSEHRENLIVETDPAILFNRLKEYRPVAMDKWIKDIKKESC